MHSQSVVEILQALGPRTAGEGARVEQKSAVKARYIFTVLDPGSNPPRSYTWTFDSGGEPSVNMIGGPLTSTRARTCRPTYTAERAILDAVSK